MQRYLVPLSSFIAAPDGKMPSKNGPGVVAVERDKFFEMAKNEIGVKIAALVDGLSGGDWSSV